MNGYAGASSFQLDIEKVSQELRVRPEIFKRLVVSFSKTIVEKMQVLEQALSQSDSVKARALLHELKGTSGNLRLQPVFAAVDTLHVALKAGESKEKQQEYLATLKTRCQEFIEYAGHLSV